MRKILRYTGVIGFLIFLILAIIILNQRRFSKKQTDPKLIDRLVSDSGSVSYDFDVKNLDIKVHEVSHSRFADVNRMPTNEYVRGNKGYYWAVDMKDSASQSILLFPPGEYIYKDNDWKVTTSLNYIYSKILDNVFKNKKYKVFIEGQADLSGDKKFTRTFVPGYVYNPIKYYPTYKSDGSSIFLYDSVFNAKQLYEPLINNDLPLLRASFLNQKLSYFSKVPTPILLQGEVKRSIGPDYRNGKIILFVDTSGSSN